MNIYVPTDADLAAQWRAGGLTLHEVTPGGMALLVANGDLDPAGHYCDACLDWHSGPCTDSEGNEI